MIDEEEDAPIRIKKKPCPLTLEHAYLAIFPIIIVSLFIASWVVLSEPEEIVPCTMVASEPPKCIFTAFEDTQAFYSYECGCFNPNCLCYVIRNERGDAIKLTLGANKAVSPVWAAVAIITTIVMFVFVVMFIDRLTQHPSE